MFVFSELLEDEVLTREIMETEENEKLLILQDKITFSEDLLQQWLNKLHRILHESNSAKVFVVSISNSWLMEQSCLMLSSYSQ